MQYRGAGAERCGTMSAWRMKSRPGLPPIPKELRALIRRMVNENR
jgi:hypothetical protein